MTLPASIVANPNVRLPHHRIHEGNFFSTHTISTGLTVASPKRFLFITQTLQPDPSDTIEIDMLYQISTFPGCRVELFEDTVVSNNGTPLDAINQNRNSTTTSVGDAFEDPVVTSEGILISSQIIGSTTTGGVGGLTIRDEQELVLKAGTTYLLKITPLIDGTDISASLKYYDARPSVPVPIPPTGP
jgi:hypothetical protein